MSNTDAQNEQVQLDLSDLDRYIGQQVVFNELREPCHTTDIRRWVQAMDYPNPVHWDEDFAKASRFGGIVAPQSFTVAMDYGHGCHPTCIGKIPGGHLIFAGEEWWFYGGLLRPGDRLVQERRFDGYSVADTKFAGPTVFARGDTIHRTEDGTMFAKERATAVRYLVEEAKKRGLYAKEKRPPRKWTKEELAEIARVRHAWILSNREGQSPRFRDVQVGDQLPRRVIGPHSLVTFALERRSMRENIWGSIRWYDPPAGMRDPSRDDTGMLAEMSYDWEARKIDPRMGDGLFHGPSSGHINADRGENVGMGGAYGYGASMNAWFVDYVAYWAGHEGYIWHSKTQFRSPAFEGDVTYFDGEVVGKQDLSPFGVPVVQVKVKQTTQDGEIILTGTADVNLPL